MGSFLRQHGRAVFFSVALHVAIVAAMTLGFSFAPRQRAPMGQQIAIQATVVDETVIQREMERLEELERQEVLRQQREERQAREAAEEARRLQRQEQERAEAARRERERVAEREQARLAELQAQRQRAEAAQRAEQERLAELQRQREAEERRQREEAERQRREEEARLARQREEEERRRREAEAAARQQAELEAQLQRELAAEDERRRAEEAGLLDEYIRLIQARIEQNWIPPPSAGAGLQCVVNVTQIPSGDVIDVRVGRCNGDAAVVRSIEAAVQRASPLPRPSLPSLFERNLILNFCPDC